jgi:hypothetical protein
MNGEDKAAKALFDAEPHAHPQGHVPNWEVQPEAIKEAFRRKARALKGSVSMATELPKGLKIETVKPLDAPAFYVQISQIMQTGNDFVISFGRNAPAVAEGLDPAGGVGVAIAVPVCILQLSPGSTKDLFLALQIELEKFEAKNGKIQTDYTRTLAAAKK